MLFLLKQVFISEAFQSSQEKDHSKALIEEVQIIKANTISTFCYLIDGKIANLIDPIRIKDTSLAANWVQKGFKFYPPPLSLIYENM